MHVIVTDDLEMRKVRAKLVPEDLSDEQKEHRVTICRELLICLEIYPHLSDRMIKSTTDLRFSSMILRPKGKISSDTRAPVLEQKRNARANQK